MARRMTVLLIVIIALVGLLVYMIIMPGESFQGALPPLDERGRELAPKLERHVETLCSNPAGRHYLEKKGLAAARDYIAAQFEASGYAVGFQSYEFDGDDYTNIEVTRAGNRLADEIIVVGAHYDAVVGAPGANDNGSGVAALLELARRFIEIELPRTLRFVAFVNEEPPHFLTGTMGSDVYARRAARQGENIVAMFALETIGYYRDDPGSQHYPPPLNLKITGSGLTSHKRYEQRCKMQGLTLNCSSLHAPSNMMTGNSIGQFFYYQNKLTATL